MVNSLSCDVAIIGGGPGGSVLAAMLAKAGVDVVCLEGKKFPRHHLGESLLAISMPLLGEIGMAEVLANQGFPVKRGAVFVWGSERKSIGLSMTNPGFAYQVRRAVFDELLLRHAADSGARVLEEHWVREVFFKEGRASGLLVRPVAGDPFEIHASIIADASGLFQFLPRKLALREEYFGPNRVALSTYLNGADRVSRPHTDDIITEACGDGWLWFIPLSREVTSVGFVGDELDVSGDYRNLLAGQIASSTMVRSLCGEKNAISRVRLLKYRNHAVRSPWWQQGYVLVGDTAAFVDPLFSTGVHATLYCAVAAAASIASFLHGEVQEPAAAQWYDAWTRANYTKTRAMIKLLYGAHPGQSRFWRSRWLGDISDASAEAELATAGVEGADFFRAACSAGQLDFAEPIMRRLPEFRCRPRPIDIRWDVPLTLAPEVERAAGWMRQGQGIVKCTTMRHRRGRTHEIRSPIGTVIEKLMTDVNGGRSLHTLMQRADVNVRDMERVGRAVAVLLDGGLVTYTPAPNG
jgi:FAD-dependent halogenase